MSGGGSPPVETAAAEAAPGRAVTIYMPKGEFFSSEQMTKFIDRLNEEVRQGATLISTKVAPT